MAHIFLPSQGFAEWRRLLAEPEKHWKLGYSAMALARCWEEADGLPLEIRDLISQSANGHSLATELLAGFPEWKVDFQDGGRSSQNDVFALVRRDGSTIALMVEGKVVEPFGPTLQEWLVEASERKRLAFILSKLGLQQAPPGSIRYQLLHRTASSVIEAERFHTNAAAMIVHSFAPDHRWFDEFQAFCSLFGQNVARGKLVEASAGHRPLYLGWATGDARFLK